MLQPDLFFVSKAREHIVTDRVWGAPDMVLEVLSPNPRIGDLDQRIDWFASYGVRECWLVHQLTRQIEVLQLAERGVVGRKAFVAITSIESVVLPNCSLRPIDLTGWAIGA